MASEPERPRLSSTPCRARWSLALLLVARAASADNHAQPAQEVLKLLSIEELMRIDVTTAGRRAEPIGTTPSAVSVITSDDIRRSAVTTIADALQLADGVHVARFNNGTWAITARGFNQNTANKLLVMVDGRTVFSPLFAGVFWNMLDYVLEDIDRIEVIRGPGATLWGSNAVNGVVNIITRHARDTQGTYVSVSSGPEDPAIVEARHGSAAGAAAWRVYGKLADRASQRLSDGTPGDDSRRRGQIGFRIDGGAGDASTWLIAGDAFHSRDSFIDRPDGEFTELALQGRWSRALADASRLTLQSYYRREYRRVPRQLTHHIDVLDVDGQHAATWAGRHSVVWGGGFRVNWDKTHASSVISFDPPTRTYPVANVFVQDEIAILSDRLFTTLGLKWEHNAFSGGEAQPSVRARLLMPRRQVIWGAVSRATRRPTRFEDDIIVPLPSGAPFVVGNDDFEAESVVAAEAGYRIQPASVISIDATVFRHDITDLRSQDAPPGGGLPIIVGNSLEGRSHGMELGVNIQPVGWWRTHVGYSWLDSEIRRQPGSRDVGGGVTEANDPHHLFNLRSSVDLPRDVEIDAMIRSIAALPNPQVPAFTELTLRIGWRPTRAIELWLAGHDLLHDRHPEFGPSRPARVEFERAVRVGITIRR